MTLTMTHPYTGELITCAQLDGTQHDIKHAVAVTQWDYCESCDTHFESCKHCLVVIGCCQCGQYHAIDCPWPL